MGHWKPIVVAPKDGTKIDLWMQWEAAPSTMGMGDAFRVPECWWDGENWVHVHNHAVKALRGEYVRYWANCGDGHDEGPDAEAAARIDYTLEIRKPEDGIYSITSSVPGLFLAGYDIVKLLADVPLAVQKLREFNGDERNAPVSSENDHG